jgi:hypothetical protein
MIRRVVEGLGPGLAVASLLIASASNTQQPTVDEPSYVSPERGNGVVSDAASIPIYTPPIPPELGNPKGTTGAATRGGRQASIQLLAPDHVGLTTSAQPILYWYVAQPTDLRVDLTIRDESSVKPVLDVQLEPPREPGIQRIPLAEHGVQLAPGKDYQWFVSLVPDPERRSKDFTVGAWIRRDNPPQAVARAIAGTSPERAVFVYAANGIWYDALAAVSSEIEVADGDARFHVQRAALLDQVGLSEVADFDRREADGS